jgi:hypothetical protein
MIAATVLAGTCVANAGASPVFDAINPNAAPAFANNTYVRYGSRDVGWYYTPTITYDIDGIYGRFLPLGVSAPASPISKTVTAEIRSERPVNGGAVLRQASFTVNLAAGGDVGGTFAPLRLSAGTTYFVDFLDVLDVGINLATWQNDANGNPQPAGGATVNLGAFYRNFDPATDFSTVGAAYGNSAGLNIAGGSPILLFTGAAVPEPSMAVVMLLAIPLFVRRRPRC